MRRVWDFIQYNNAIPIGLFILFGGTGAVFAASPQAQQAIYSSQDQVQSVDNTYIVNANLANQNFGLQITSVTEDTDNYYVSYTYNTIDVVNYVWQEVAVNKGFTLSKKELGNQDLGLFVAKQLGQEITQQLAYLTQVQEKERTNGTTLKTVATVYSGLVGKMLNPTEKTFPGYVPVVAEQPSDSNSGVASVALAGAGATFVATPPPVPTQEDIKSMVDQAVAAALAQQAAAAATTTPTQPQVGAAPVITISGDNPANIAIGSTYNDLGATVTDDKDNNLGVHTAVNGTAVDTVSIDTSTAATYTITYSATDTDGNTTSATRTVVVYDPAAIPPTDGGGGTGTTTPPMNGGGSATTTPPADTPPADTPPADTPPPTDQGTTTVTALPPADTSTSTTGTTTGQ